MRNGTQPLRALGALLALMGILAIPPYAVVAVDSFEVSDASPLEAMIGTVTIAKDHWGDPREAYPANVRERMPAGARWWIALAVPLGVAGLIGGALFVPLDVVTARRRVGRRSYDPRGSRPREWARPRDVRSLQVRRRSGERFTLGRLDGRLLAGDREAHTMLCAPPRSGKTTGYVIPWLLEHDGPALVTSVRHDVWDATAARRNKGGEVWVFDPFSPDSCCWNPLDGCENWGRALRQAHWLAEATSRPGDSSHVEQFWGEEGAKLLAPLLHAAAISGQSIGQVVSWLESEDRKAPIETLHSDGDPAAQSQLEGVLALDSRNAGTTYMSTAHLLHAYRYPEVLATAQNGFTPTDLLDGDAPTLYLTASSRHQKMLAPIFVGLISSIFDAAIEHSRTTGLPLDPLLRALLDETANCAALQSLPGRLSDIAPHGVRIAHVWQTVAQMNAAYGDAKDTIMGASTDKVFLGPISDEATRQEVAGLLGQDTVTVDDHSTLGPKASAQDLQQLQPGRALVISGSHPPALTRVEPHWRIPQFATERLQSPSC